MKKSSKKTSKAVIGVGGVKSPNTPVSVVKKATPYTGGISKAPAGAAKKATPYTGGKQTPPTGAIPASKMGGSTKMKSKPKSKSK